MKHQSGNALFLILIAVALFAALSYAITTSGRGGGNIDRETAAIQAAQITQTAQQVESVVQRLQLLSSCSGTEISFENPTSPQDYTNSNTPIDGSCFVFGENTGLSYSAVLGGIGEIESAGANDELFFTGAHCRVGFGDIVSSCDTSEKELELMVQNVSREVCIEINRGLGIGVPGAEPPEENVQANISSIFAFNGVYTATTGGSVIIDHADLNNKAAGCMLDNAGSNLGTYFYYHVLMAR